MTDIDDDEMPVVEEGPTPRRWSWFALAACFFALIANLLGTFVEFYGEISVGLYRHSLWKADKRVDKEAVSRFREQLAEL